MEKLSSVGEYTTGFHTDLWLKISKINLKLIERRYKIADYALEGTPKTAKMSINIW